MWKFRLLKYYLSSANAHLDKEILHYRIVVLPSSLGNLGGCSHVLRKTVELACRSSYKRMGGSRKDL